MRTEATRGKPDNQPWSFVVPIGNLVLGDIVGRELRVNRVIFVDRDKLPYVRRRLGFYFRVSELDRRKDNSNFFKKANTYAIVRHTGCPQQVESACLKILREELAMLNLSYLGYAKRKQVSFPAIVGEHRINTFGFVLTNPKTSATVAVSKSAVNPNGLLLDGRWALSRSARTFKSLIKIFSKSVKVSPEWKEDLRKASILVGEGLKSEDRAMSFLKNVIALETMLTVRGDKVADTLSTRAKAFLGWVGFWDTEKFEQRIERIYQKRNALVHSGDKYGVDPEDLIFTDDLLYNLIANLVSFPGVFGSKKKIVDFSEKVEAERILGLPSKVRPKGLSFSRSLYREKDLEEL